MDSPTLTNLLSLIAAYACVPPESIGMMDTLADHGITDSLDHVQLILDVEEHFKIDLPDEESCQILTVAGLFDAIIRAQGKGLD